MKDEKRSVERPLEPRTLDGLEARLAVEDHEDRGFRLDEDLGRSVFNFGGASSRAPGRICARQNVIERQLQLEAADGLDPGAWRSVCCCGGRSSGDLNPRNVDRRQRHGPLLAVDVDVGLVPDRRVRRFRLPLALESGGAARLQLRSLEALGERRVEEDRRVCHVESSWPVRPPPIACFFGADFGADTV